jgi:hypothetical protein
MDVLEWVLSCKRHPKIISEHPSREASKRGDLQMLQVFHSCNAVFYNGMQLFDATVFGHMNIVTWLLDNFGMRSEDFMKGLCLSAAKSGNLLLLQHVRALATEWPEEFIADIPQVAVCSGNVAMVEWLKTYDVFDNAFNDLSIFQLAARHGHLDMIKCLGARHPSNPWDASILAATASYGGQVGTLQWLHEQGPTFKDVASVYGCFHYALKANSVETLEWISQFLPRDSAMRCYQSRSHPLILTDVNVEVWKWVRSHFPTYFSSWNWKLFAAHPTTQIDDDLYDWLVTVGEI